MRNNNDRKIEQYEFEIEHQTRSNIQQPGTGAKLRLVRLQAVHLRAWHVQL
jgi:hypothetical protein